MFILKKDTRLKIIDENNKVVYSPPDFIRKKMLNRKQLQQVCDKLNDVGYYDINIIIEFESSIHP